MSARSWNRSWYGPSQAGIFTSLYATTIKLTWHFWIFCNYSTDLYMISERFCVEYMILKPLKERWQQVFSKNTIALPLLEKGAEFSLTVYTSKRYHTQCSLSADRDQTSVTVHVAIKPEKVATVGNLYSHQLRTNLSSLPAPYSLRDKIFHPHHFSIHLNQFTHPEDADNLFIQNAGTQLYFIKIWWLTDMLVPAHCMQQISNVFPYKKSQIQWGNFHTRETWGCSLLTAVPLKQPEENPVVVGWW